MSVTTENAPVRGQTTLQENRAGEGVYASLFEKINLAPASHLGDINDFLDDAALSGSAGGGASHRGDAGVYGSHPSVRSAGGKARQNADRPPYRRAGFPDKPSAGRGDAPSGVSAGRIPVARPQTAGGHTTDYRQNVKTEILDVAKDDLRQDFEDAPELIQSGLYWHTYTAEYDTPGGEADRLR